MLVEVVAGTGVDGFAEAAECVAAGSRVDPGVRLVGEGHLGEEGEGRRAVPSLIP